MSIDKSRQTAAQPTLIFSTSVCHVFQVVQAEFWNMGAAIAHSSAGLSILRSQD